MQNLLREKRKGPLFVIVTDGCNDCEVYAKMAKLIAGKYTVVSFDPRGGTRSMPIVDRKVIPESFADDVASIIKHTNTGKATVFGCSSGGHGALMTGVKYPELVRDVIAHEAALQMDA